MSSTVGSNSSTSPPASLPRRTARWVVASKASAAILCLALWGAVYLAVRVFFWDIPWGVVLLLSWAPSYLLGLALLRRYWLPRLLLDLLAAVVMALFVLHFGFPTVPSLALVLLPECLFLLHFGQPREWCSRVTGRLAGVPVLRILTHHWVRFLVNLLSLTLILGGTVVMVDYAYQRLNPVQPPPLVTDGGPSLAELNRSIALAEPFLESLVNPTGFLAPGAVEDGTGNALTTRSGTSATASEYYGLPIRVRTNLNRNWRLLGNVATTVTPLVIGTTSETFMLHWALSRGTGEVKNNPYYDPDQEILFDLETNVDWNYTPKKIKLTVRNTNRLPTRVRVQARLGDLDLGVWTQQNTGEARSFIISRDDRGLFRSFRYTLRHATANAYHYSLYQGATDLADSLRKSLLGGGLKPENDTYASLWRDSASDELYYPSIYSAYNDCSVHPSQTKDSYAYRSKVCLGLRKPYVWLAMADTISTPSAAIHWLDRAESPTVGFEDLDSGDHTPELVSWRLQQLFRDRGDGIPQCLPLTCQSHWVSGVRTSTFGVLESILGYSYDDATARTYADAAANTIIRTQIQPDGIVRTATNVFYRPIYRGSFYTFWDRKNSNYFANHVTYDRKDSLAMNGADWFLDHQMNMRPEYKGVVPSNAETSYTAYAFLITYRCEKYGVGCGESPSAAASLPVPQPTPVPMLPYYDPFYLTELPYQQAGRDVRYGSFAQPNDLCGNRLCFRGDPSQPDDTPWWTRGLSRRR